MNLINTTGWTLLHFLWQGTAIALLFAMANAFLQRRSANARYLAACAAMLLMVGCIAATFARLLPGASPVSMPTAMVHLAPIALPVTALAPAATARAVTNWLPVFVYAWFAGVCLLAVRSLGGWLMVQRFRKSALRPAADIWQERLATLAHRLRVSRTVRLCESAIAEVPSVVGWLRPVVLLPASALTGLTPRQLEALLAHELAHIRRHDYVINLLQTAIETVLFYHPAVWWVGRRMRAERENCCDDLAVRVCGDVLGYARALARMEELRGQMPAFAMAADGGSLFHRVQRLLRNGESEGVSAADWLTAAGVTLCAVAVWAAPHLSVRSKAIPPPLPEPSLMRLAVQSSNANDMTMDVRRVLHRHPRMVHALTVAFVGQADPAPAAEPSPSPAPMAEETAQSSAHGFLAGLDSAGYRNLTVDQLIELKEYGVTPDYIRALQSAGYHPSVQELISLKQYGVSPDYIEDLRKNGLNNLDIKQLIKFKMYGAQPSTIATMRAAGYNLTPDQIVSMQMYGVTPDLARKIKELGFGDPTPEQLIHLQMHGVTPEYATAMKQTGLKDLSLDALVRLKNHGAEPAQVREIEQLGFANLSIDDVVRLSNYGVTPDYVRKARQHGFNNLTLEQIVKLKQYGILD